MVSLDQTHSYLFRCISSEEYEKHLREFHRRREQMESDAILSGKEVFDFIRLAGLCHYDIGGCHAPAGVQSYYRNMYYSDYPEVQTIDEFARLLNTMT